MRREALELAQQRRRQPTRMAIRRQVEAVIGNEALSFTAKEHAVGIRPTSARERYGRSTLRATGLSTI
jgi:hypothetical protein